MSTAIAQYDDTGSYLSQWRDPEDVLTEATKAAVALKRVVSMKKDPVKFNGEQYLEREDWGTVAKFYGCNAKPLGTEYVEFGPVRGFKAVAVVIDRNGNEVGRAESMCLSDEENWGSVPKYEWKERVDAAGKKIWDPNLFNGKGGYVKDKVKVGETQKPLFQLMSMAQTRAEAKALKGVFSWVVVLAGYKPTPAEEMTPETIRESEPQRDPIQQPQSTKQTAAQPAQTTSASESTKPAAAQTQCEVNVEGPIEEVRQGKEGSIWLSLRTGKLIHAPKEKIVREMAVGYFIKCKGLLCHRDKLDFYALGSVIALTPVEDEPPAGALAEDAQQVAQEMFPASQPAANPVVQGMVANGTLTPASHLTGPGTIGPKRAQRIYAMCNTHKADNHGFNEAEIKRLLVTLTPPLEHLRDLPTDLYAEFENMATGARDWREMWKDDETDSAEDGIG